MSTLSVFGICCVSPPLTPPTEGDVSVLFIPDSIKLNNYLVHIAFFAHPVVVVNFAYVAAAVVVKNNYYHIAFF